MMRVLVTGGAGFIGSNLIEHIIDRPEIERLVNLDCLTYAGNLATLEPLANHPKYFFEKVDIRDKRAVLRVLGEYDITHVMHLAAESHVDRSIVGPDDFIHTNIVGTFHLLEACRELWSTSASERRFLHVSTDEVYGSLGPTGYFTESTPYAPRSPYSASKASSDMLVRAYHHTYALPVLLTNCSNNYGPGQYPEKLIPMVVQNVIARKPIPIYGDGMNIRDWLFVRDHTEALWQVLTRGRLGETYNIGANNEWPNLRVVELVCDLCDELAPQSSKNARSLITFVEDRLGHDRRYAIDASKIRSELGWASRTTFPEGIRATVAWYFDHQPWVRQVLSRL